MGESKISAIELVKSKDEYSSDENIEINVPLEKPSMRLIGLKHTTTTMFRSN
jgi:hypothetical protein